MYFYRTPRYESSSEQQGVETTIGLKLLNRIGSRRDRDLPDRGTADLLQGIEVPLDEPSSDAQANGFRAFRRYACKMANRHR